MAGGSVFARARPLFLARAFGAAVTFAIPLALARLLDVSSYGTFKQFFLLAATLQLALTLGVPQSLYYFLPRSEGERRATFLRQTLCWLAGSGGLVAAALFAAGPILQRIGGPALAAARLPLAVYAGALLAASALEHGLTAQGRTRAAAVAFGCSDLVRTGALLLPAVVGLALPGVLWGAACFSVLRLLAAWWIHGRRGRGPFVDRSLLAVQLRYALPFGAAMLLAIPQQQFHQYVVALSTTPAVFAVYAVGCFNLPVVDLLYSPTSEVLMHRIGEIERQGRDEREAAEAFREASGKLAYAFLPLAAGLFAIAPDFIGLLYTERFVAAAPIFRVALVAVLVAIFPVDGVLRARGRTGLLFASYAAKAAITVPLVLLLFGRLGPIGAMAGWAIAELIHTGALLCLAARALLPTAASGGALAGTAAALRELLPARHLGRAATAALAGAAVALLAQHLVVLRPLASVVLVGGGFWLVYLAALVAAGVRPSSLLSALRARG